MSIRDPSVRSTGLIASIADRSLPWQGDDLLVYPATTIELAAGALRQRESTSGHLVLGKSRRMLERMLAVLSDVLVEHVVDVGIFQGGSVAFLNEHFRPRKLVALDLKPGPPALHEYVGRQQGGRVKLFENVNQADDERVTAICDREFRDEPIDLVIDDASHLYAPTRATFCNLFPRMRENAYYVIEDWGWAHWRGDHWQIERGGPYFAQERPLSNLLFELMLLTASKNEIAAELIVNDGAAYVRRGPAPCSCPLPLTSLINNRGDPLPWLEAD